MRSVAYASMAPMRMRAASPQQQMRQPANPMGAPYAPSRKPARPPSATRAPLRLLRTRPTLTRDLLSACRVPPLRPNVVTRGSLNPQFAETHSTAAADVAARMMEDHTRRVEGEVAQLRHEINQLKVERMGRCEEQLFEHRHILDTLTREKQVVEEVSTRMARIEESSLQWRRGQEAMLHDLDEERHQRELRQEQFAARLDSIMSSVEGARKSLGREQESVMQHVSTILEDDSSFYSWNSFGHSVFNSRNLLVWASQVSTILDERDRRVTQELLESDNFRYVLQEEQSQTVEIMKVKADKKRRREEDRHTTPIKLSTNLDDSAR